MGVNWHSQATITSTTIAIGFLHHNHHSQTHCVLTNKYHIETIADVQGRLHRGLVQLFDLCLCRSGRLCNSRQPRQWETHQRDCLGRIKTTYQLLTKRVLIKSIETFSNQLAWHLWLIQRQPLQWTFLHFGLFLVDHHDDLKIYNDDTCNMTDDIGQRMAI